MEPTDPYGLCTTALVVGVASGFVPLVNTEAFLLWVAATTPVSERLPVVIFTTLGQMVAKAGLYLIGCGALGIPLGKHATKVDALRARLAGRKGSTSALLFASATCGIPPFYLVSVLTGVLRWSFTRFFLIGCCGRLLRFSLVLLMP